MIESLHSKPLSQPQNGTWLSARLDRLCARPLANRVVLEHFERSRICRLLGLTGKNCLVACLVLSKELLKLPAMQCGKLSSRRLNLCPDCINFHPSLLPKHRGCWSASQLGLEKKLLSQPVQKWLDCAGQASGAFLRATPRQVSHATAWWRPHGALSAVHRHCSVP